MAGEKLLQLPYLAKKLDKLMEVHIHTERQMDSWHNEAPAQVEDKRKPKPIRQAQGKKRKARTEKPVTAPDAAPVEPSAPVITSTGCVTTWTVPKEKAHGKKRKEITKKEKTFNKWKKDFGELIERTGQTKVSVDQLNNEFNQIEEAMSHGKKPKGIKSHRKRRAKRAPAKHERSLHPHPVDGEAGGRFTGEKEKDADRDCLQQDEERRVDEKEDA